MATTKVKNTETYKDAQGEHLVAKGKLLLIENSEVYKIGELVADYKNTILSIKRPIIISETEEIKVGDIVYSSWSLPERSIFTVKEIKENQLTDTNNYYHPSSYCKKVLVLPEQFSPKHLQAIVDGKLKDQDEVYVELNQTGWMDKVYGYCIKLTDNHIKLFPVKKEQETWNAIFRNYQLSGEGSYSTWLQKHYSPPLKK